MPLPSWLQNLLSPFIGGALNAVDKDPWEKKIHSGKASSFADPADVAAYRRCIAKGGSEKACLAVGDNGIGTPALGEYHGGSLRGVDTTGPTPMCALPPGDWKPLGDKARGAKVLVKANGRAVICYLRDTLPAKPKHGVIIDLSPAACAALALKPPILVDATWQFVPENFTL